MALLNVEYHDSLESTQDLALDYVRKGYRLIHAVRAGYQSKGRGRLDRKWLSEANQNLLVSYILWKLPMPEKPWEYGFIMALAVVEAIEDSFKAIGYAGETPRVRWPNDIILGDKKLGGLMLDVRKSKSGDDIIVIGLGLNVNQTDFPKELESKAVSMKTVAGHDFECDHLCRAIWERFIELYPPLWASPRTLYGAWRDKDATIGKKYIAGDGREGIAERITNDGYLVVKFADGTTTELPSADVV